MGTKKNKLKKLIEFNKIHPIFTILLNHRNRRIWDLRIVLRNIHGILWNNFIVLDFAILFVTVYLRVLALWNGFNFSPILERYIDYINLILRTSAAIPSKKFALKDLFNLFVMYLFYSILFYFFYIYTQRYDLFSKRTRFILGKCLPIN